MRLCVSKHPQIRSAAAEPAPVGRAGVGWGGHFGWKALTTAESSLATGAVKVAVGWSDEASAAGSAQLTGQKMPNEDYSVRTSSPSHPLQPLINQLTPHSLVFSSS